MIELIKSMPDWLPLAVLFFGIQAWALKVVYAIHNKLDKHIIGNDARIKALELEVSTKVSADQARSIAHQYHQDMHRLREQIKAELLDEGKTNAE